MLCVACVTFVWYTQSLLVQWWGGQAAIVYGYQGSMSAAGCYQQLPTHFLQDGAIHSWRVFYTLAQPHQKPNRHTHCNDQNTTRAHCPSTVVFKKRPVKECADSQLCSSNNPSSHCKHQHRVPLAVQCSSLFAGSAVNAGLHMTYQQTALLLALLLLRAVSCSTGSVS